MRGLSMSVIQSLYRLLLRAIARRQPRFPIQLLRISTEMAAFSVLFSIEKAPISTEIRSSFCDDDRAPMCASVLLNDQSQNEKWIYSLPFTP